MFKLGRRTAACVRMTVIMVDATRLPEMQDVMQLTGIVAPYMIELGLHIVCVHVTVIMVDATRLPEIQDTLLGCTLLPNAVKLQ